MRLGLGLGLDFGLVRQLSSQASAAASSCQVCGMGVFRGLLHAVSRAIVRHLGLFRRVCPHTHGYAACGMRYSV